MIWRKKEKKKAQYQFNSERVFLVATQPAKTAYSYFQTSSVGLSEEEIGQRQSAYGKNEISREQKKNPLVLFIRTFINPFIGVLTALANNITRYQFRNINLLTSRKPLYETGIFDHLHQ